MKRRRVARDVHHKPVRGLLLYDDDVGGGIAVQNQLAKRDATRKRCIPERFEFEGFPRLVLTQTDGRQDQRFVLSTQRTLLMLHIRRLQKRSLDQQVVIGAIVIPEAGQRFLIVSLQISVPDEAFERLRLYRDVARMIKALGRGLAVDAFIGEAIDEL